MCPPENIKNNPDTDDLIKDGEVYTILLNDLSPDQSDKSALDNDILEQREQKVI